MAASPSREVGEDWKVGLIHCVVGFGTKEREQQRGVRRNHVTVISYPGVSLYVELFAPVVCNPFAQSQLVTHH